MAHLPSVSTKRNGLAVTVRGTSVTGKLVARSKRPATLVSALLLVSALFATASCGGGPAAFSTSFPDNRESHIENLIQRIKDAPPRRERSVAVGVTGRPSKLYAFDLESRRVLWQTPTDTRYTPFVVGDWVVTVERAGIFVRNLQDGASRLVINAVGETFVGADAQGGLLAVVLSKGSGEYARSLVVALKNGSEAWRRELQGVAGSPAVVGDIVLVPWNHQNLSALEGANGEEFARVRVLDAVFGLAFVDRGNLYAGSEYGVARLTKALSSGLAKQGPFFALPEKKLPGQPFLLRDVYSGNPVPSLESALHHVQLSWLPSVVDEKTFGLQDNNLYLVFYTFIIALDPSTYAIRWIYTHPVDIAGSAAIAGGILFADEEGEIGLLSANNGGKLWNANSGLSGLVVQLRPGETSRLPAGGKPTGPTLLRDQLLAAAQHADARLVPIRLLAVGLLSKLSDPEATSALIELCDSQSYPPISKAACQALEGRSQGADYVLAALQRHAAYLEGTKEPPIGYLAKAAARFKEPRAVGLLIAHLRDPNTPAQDLSALVKALAELNDRAAVEPLKDFLLMYHADAADPHMAEALSATIYALVVLSGPAGAEVLKEVADDELGTAAVRERARVALEELDRQRNAAERNEADAQKSQQQEARAEQAAAKEEPAPARSLTLAVVEEVLAPVQKKLKACLGSSGPQMFSARVLISVIEGQVSSIAVAPERLQGCVEPIVRAQKFPITQTHKRETVTYTFGIR